MKFFNYLKVELLTVVKQAPALLLTIVIIPFILSYFLSVTTGGVFDIHTEPPRHSVYINHPKSTERSKQLVALIQQLADAEIFKLSDDVTKADYQVSIAETFEQSLQTGKQPAVTISQIKGKSIKEAHSIKMYMNQLVAAVAETTRLQSIVKENNENAAVVERIIHDAQQAANNIQYGMEKIDGRDALSGAQYFSVTTLGYIFIIIISSVIVASVKPELSGIRKRIALLPLSSIQRTLFDLGSSIVIYTMLSSLYLLLWKIINPETFSGNGFLIIGWVLTLIIFVTSIGGLISQWVTERWSTVILTGLSLVWVVFSGSIPFNRLSSHPLFELLGKNWIYNIFSEPFMTIIKGESFARHIGLLWMILIISLISVIGQIIVRKSREV
ncbi:hypothetical protein I4Q36_00650 [Tuanshanicoccus lijuaniae]|uniref:ABC transporter permease n=1 Tax=Aerococcaceae bacterium zg-1292 TaxID=2774330 RepID=UPI0019377A2C|nr:hypothetical protein [Aerococcaceae bacterium zg-1292]MBS4456170.1 hypothetical protein [Aerococcaceae bacterium zg-A91]MBS4458021.1 hypothetical protein [Aerococcaceae bacterium zg-BR33]QQA37262.1 hypothetical protein I4Q36_00650 [Aerococcaceae bacterium zg-1292]